jgi:hypothetical protein
MQVFAQIQNCTRDLRQTACALLDASGPVTLTGADLAALGIGLMDLSTRIETALSESVVEEMLRDAHPPIVIDVDFVEVRS